MSRTIGASLLAIVALGAFRLWLADVFPLTDTTEARYSEISRKMVETSDWITPQHDYGVPYWAKPPLAFWMSAAGIELLGPTQLAPRLPILLLSFGFLGLYFAWLRRWLGLSAASAGVIMLMSALLYFVSMAAVMTDMVLTICVASGLMAFWSRYRGGSGRWEVLLYVGLGLGLLTKGPLAAVLTLGPILGWCLSTRRVAEVWRRFAWLKGAALTLAVALPWYIAAEIKTPGFLRYFIVGEHIMRFLVPGWNGDLYGQAHQEPLGMIWAYFFVGVLPWSVLLVPLMVARRRALASRWSANRELVVLGLWWALVPLLLFTFSANIISPYIVPAVPGAVVAILALTARPSAIDRPLLRLSWLGAVLLAVPLFWLTNAAIYDPAFVSRFTQRSVIEAIRSTRAGAAPVYYWNSRYFSADYYSEGRTATLHDAGPLEERLSRGQPFSLVVSTAQLEAVPRTVLDRLHRAARIGDFAVLQPAATSSPKHSAEPAPSGR
jgi:4-amino-4-deoxy-L-arabinose transferase-like glycosyltransferase